MPQTDFEQREAALKRQIADATRQLAVFAKRNAELERQVEGQLTELPVDQRPVYELTAPYYAPDDIHYPEGFMLEDVTGRIIPNEYMVPQNEPARINMQKWLESQPVKDFTPSIDLILQAATEYRPREGEGEVDQKTWAKMVMDRAIELKFDHMGIAKDARGTIRNLTMPAAPGRDVPLMPNTRINGADLRPSSMPLTRARGNTAPADREAPPISTSRTAMLGKHAPAGVVR